MTHSLHSNPYCAKLFKVNILGKEKVYKIYAWFYCLFWLEVHRSRQYDGASGDTTLSDQKQSGAIIIFLICIIIHLFIPLSVLYIDHLIGCEFLKKGVGVWFFLIWNRSWASKKSVKGKKKQYQLNEEKNNKSWITSHFKLIRSC